MIAALMSRRLHCVRVERNSEVKHERSSKHVQRGLGVNKCLNESAAFSRAGS